jgi:hypothetical protein
MGARAAEETRAPSRSGLLLVLEPTRIWKLGFLDHERHPVEDRRGMVYSAAIVKSELENPRDPGGSFVLAPHFPHVLSDLNNSLPEPISDHSPITVDLPFHEPANLGATAN